MLIELIATLCYVHCCEHSTTGTILNYNQVFAAICNVMLNKNKLATGYIGTSDVSEPYLYNYGLCQMADTASYPCIHI